jgi:hypothetical protein
MSAPTVTVDLFSARLRLDPVADPTTSRARFTSAVEELRHGRLAAAVREVEVGSGRWCVRRLEVPLVLDDDAATPLGDRWAGQIAAAVARLVRERPADAVHYGNDLDVLVDVVSSLARGRTGRAWAWRHVVPSLDPDRTDPRRTALVALAARAELAVPALVRAVDRCGVVRVDRLLGPDGWRAVASLVSTIATAEAPRSRERTPDAVAETRWVVRAEALTEASSLARCLLASGLRADDTVVRAWATVVVAEVEPASLGRPSCHELVDVVVARLRSKVADRREPESAVPDLGKPQVATADSTTTTGTAEAAPTPEVAGPVGTDDVPAPVAAPVDAATEELPSGSDDRLVAVDDLEVVPDREALATSWAGLLFLLATAEEAGLPDALLNDEAFDDLPLAWAMHQLARRLAPVEDEDPAALALAGRCGPPGPGAPRLNPDVQVTEITGDRLDAVARQWALVTVRRLAAADPPSWKAAAAGDDDPVAAIAPVVGRPGRVEASPGWIDVHLELADVDVTVRRAGLDLDPGWVPWLGVVVRFCYE